MTRAARWWVTMWRWSDAIRSYGRREPLMFFGVNVVLVGEGEGLGYKPAANDP